MNRISEITKQDILDLFQNGMEIEHFFDTKKISYFYFGRLQEIDFLKRLYNLEKMPSYDSRYPNAERDIWQHTVNNDDYPLCWIFEDERFQLKNGSDEVYLKFICEIFHPVVRDEKGYWKDFFAEINRLLQNDGYELYSSEKISNRDVYGWKIFQPDETKMFIPYSQRNAKMIKAKKSSFSLKRNIRNQIYQLLERYNEEYRTSDETGWQYNTSTKEDVFNDIRQFYVPKYYDNQSQYVETNNLQDFILSNSPYCVLDAIEFFEKYNGSNDFVTQVNTIFRLNEVPLRLDNGKIISVFESQMANSSIAPVQEAGLKELLQEASSYYEERNLKNAVEKLWDAFERLKTYYSPALDKKKSVNKIIGDMSGNIKPYEEVFEKEFHELTTIGNNFRIRHHETTKIDIEDTRHYEYFYKRCMALISSAILYLDGREIL